MITIEGTNVVIPNVTHATATLNQWNRVVLRMNDGYVFWDRNDYRDENGEMYEPTSEEIGYSRYGVFSPETDFSTFVIVKEDDKNQTK
jgi:hypothetical protein